MHKAFANDGILCIAGKSDKVSAAGFVYFPKDKWKFRAMRSAVVLAGIIRQVDRVINPIKIRAGIFRLCFSQLNGRDAERVIITQVE